MAGKLVKFTYSGGTEPGAERRVQVENVALTRSGSTVIIGWDLDRQAYRSFRSDLVSNLTVVEK